MDRCIYHVCCVLRLVAQPCPTLCDLMDCSPPGSSVHGGSSGKNYGNGLPCSPPGNLPILGIEPRSPTLQGGSLPSEPSGKPKNTRVGSLSLLQGIFLTQELNRGFLHCRWILSQLSYQGSPSVVYKTEYYSKNPLFGHFSKSEIFATLPFAALAQIFS